MTKYFTNKEGTAWESNGRIIVRIKQIGHVYSVTTDFFKTVLPIPFETWVTSLKSQSNKRLNHE